MQLDAIPLRFRELVGQAVVRGNNVYLLPVQDTDLKWLYSFINGKKLLEGPLKSKDCCFEVITCNTTSFGGNLLE